MWRNDEFVYTVKLLKTIAENYTELYEGLPRSYSEETNPWELAEYKADFDMALNSLGRGHWRDIQELSLSDYKNYGLYQKVIIADILGIPDNELTGFYNIDNLRRYAYHLMKVYLNGDS